MEAMDDHKKAQFIIGRPKEGVRFAETEFIFWNSRKCS